MLMTFEEFPKNVKVMMNRSTRVLLSKTQCTHVGVCRMRSYSAETTNTANACIKDAERERGITGV